MLLADSPIQARLPALQDAIDPKAGKPELVQQAREFLLRCTPERTEVPAPGISESAARAIASAGEHGLEALFSRFVAAIQTRGYRFAAFEKAPVDFSGRKLYLRYDVHVHDLPAAFVLADLHERLAIPGSFQITWRFSPFEEQAEAYFLALRQFDQRYVQFGLHCSPNLSHIIYNDFDGDRRAALQAVKDGTFDKRLEALADAYERYGEDSDALRQIVEGGERIFIQQAESFRAHFGDWTTVSGHGQRMSAAFARAARRNPRLEPLRPYFMPPQFLDRLDLRAQGFQCEVTNFPDAAVPQPILFDNPKSDFTYEYESRMRLGYGFVVLTHPASWTCSRLADLPKELIDGAAGDCAAEAGDEACDPHSSREPDTSVATSFDPADVVFLAGFTRGGTTWTRNVLSAHDSVVAVAGEISYSAHRRTGLSRDIILREIERRCPETYEPGYRLVVKGPVNSTVFDQLARQVPEASFIYILRDPRDVFVSHKRGTQDWLQTETNQSVEGCMQKIRNYYEGYRRAATLHRAYSFYYETLHQSFLAEAGQLFDFLGVANDTKTLRAIRKRTSFQRQTGRVHAENRSAGPRKGVIADWVHHLEPDEAAWFRNSPYWSAFFEQHGYDWVTVSVSDLLGRLAMAGVKADLLFALNPEHGTVDLEAADCLMSSFDQGNDQTSQLALWSSATAPDHATGRALKARQAGVSTPLTVVRTPWTPDPGPVTDALNAVGLSWTLHDLSARQDRGAAAPCTGSITCANGVLFQHGMPDAFDPRRPESYTSNPERVRVVLDVATVVPNAALSLAFRDDR